MTLMVTGQIGWWDLLNHFAKGFLKLASILIGIIVGYIVSIPFGMVDLAAVAQAKVFQIPQIMHFGIKFEPSSCIAIGLLFAINAIQAIGDQPDGQIDIQVYCNETEEVLIEIKNNGPVIPPEIVEHIFIPFFTTKEGGSGIGLSISRQIMRLSGGSLTLLPDNKETKFILKFK